MERNMVTCAFFNSIDPSDVVLRIQSLAFWPDIGCAVASNSPWSGDFHSATGRETPAQGRSAACCVGADPSGVCALDHYEGHAVNLVGVARQHPVRQPLHRILL